MPQSLTFLSISSRPALYFAMGAFEMRLFSRAAILLFCCVLQHGQAADHTVFGLCDVGDVISVRSGSLVVSKGRDCTRVILAPSGWRIKFTLHEIDMFDAVAFIHDGGTVAGTLKYEQGIRVLLAGRKPIVFYSSSNALLVHTDRISSNGNKFNATFEVLPHPLDKCACAPSVLSAQSICTFYFMFYFQNDELKKTCKITCDIRNDTSGAIDRSCTIRLDKPTLTWPSNRLHNESRCVNGTKMYPKPSNVNCLHYCALGKFFNNDSGICDWCDYGYFQNSTTALNPVCHRCPAGNTTAFVGARSENDCMHKCRKGQFAKLPSCFDCAIGYFMPYEGNRFPKCYKCPPGNTTLSVGTANRTGCVDQCTLGEYFNITQGMCMLCPNNTYQNETTPSNTRSCKMCQTNRVTLSTGAVSIELCIGPCSAGQYLNATSRSCKLCPVNTYKDENQTSFMCKKCPHHKITQNKGSTNISHCIYPCIEGECFNLTSEACEMCPNNTYQNNIGQGTDAPTPPATDVSTTDTSATTRSSNKSTGL